MRFEWDHRKAANNLAKHSVDFTEAMTVFSDSFEVMIDDPDHSEGEYRSISLGLFSTGRLLVVSYTERSKKIRIISAREASSKERRHYESAS